jgi:hypothetical protein
MTRLGKGLCQRVCDELAATNAQAASPADAILESCTRKNCAFANVRNCNSTLYTNGLIQAQSARDILRIRMGEVRQAAFALPIRIENLAPQVRLELTTLRLTAGCSAIELLRNAEYMPRMA